RDPYVVRHSSSRRLSRKGARPQKGPAPVQNILPSARQANHAATIRPMGVLRRFLYLAAVAWAVGGGALIFYPHWVVVSLFDQFPYPDFAGVRIAGVAAVSLAMLMVIVANHLNDAWWW